MGDPFINWLGRKTLVGENDGWRFYKTHFTESATEYSKTRWKLDNLLVLYAEEKTLEAGSFAIDIFDTETPSQEKDYVLIDTKENCYLFSTKVYEDMLYHIDMRGISKTFDDSGGNFKNPKSYKKRDGNKLLQNTASKRSGGSQEKTSRKS